MAYLILILVFWLFIGFKRTNQLPVPFYKRFVLIIGWLVFAILTLGLLLPYVLNPFPDQPWSRLFILIFCALMACFALLIYLEARCLKLKPRITREFIRDIMLVVSLPCIVLYIGFYIFLFLPTYHKIDNQLVAQPIADKIGKPLSFDQFLSVYQQSYSASSPLDTYQMQFELTGLVDFMSNNGLDVSGSNVAAFEAMLVVIDEKLSFHYLLLTFIIFFWLWGISFYLALSKNWRRDYDGSFIYD
ncbi:hypothetical protein N5853_12100 [Bartonella sp. HY329]|uniref:hypothetical protein n=1 Tax=unclassified Bartonella TaxID=2645622 RepID=UPI0021C617BF|nr:MULTISPECIES: hypothetical protein [unclassified Bartonella]UXM94820.1 hypothetical protein N5853_12100 [Bartonella sp. HY329]UXN09143.1 hypothetical protein N5852_12110 [Bartonella sp. HY328]